VEIIEAYIQTSCFLIAMFAYKLKRKDLYNRGKLESV